MAGWSAAGRCPTLSIIEILPWVSAALAWTTRPSAGSAISTITSVCPNSIRGGVEMFADEDGGPGAQCICRGHAAGSIFCAAVPGVALTSS